MPIFHVVLRGNMEPRNGVLNPGRKAGGRGRQHKKRGCLEELACANIPLQLVVIVLHLQQGVICSKVVIDFIAVQCR